MPKYLQIQAQIEKLQKEAEGLRKRELAQTISHIKKAIAAFGLTAEDLGLAGGTKRRGRPAKVKSAAKRGRPASGKKRAKKSKKVDKRSVVAPKYRNASSGETWTGRGKQPRWLAQAIKSGKKLDDFRI